MQKLEGRVDKLRKAYLASVVGDDDFLAPDNYLYLMYMVSYRRLQVVSNKRYLFRKRRYRKFCITCIYDRDLNNQGDDP